MAHEDPDEYVRHYASVEVAGGQHGFEAVRRASNEDARVKELHPWIEGSLYCIDPNESV